MIGGEEHAGIQVLPFFSLGDILFLDSAAAAVSAARGDGFIWLDFYQPVCEELLVTSQETYGVNLVGPTRLDTGWQARQTEGGFAAENFNVDSERQQVTCPAGKTNQYWQSGLDTRGNTSIHIRFDKADCGICPLHIQCTRSQPPRRTITVRPQPQQLALQAAREREKTEAFKKQYAHRVGIEGTISLGVRSFDLWRTRYIGLAKMYLQHILIACGMNLIRLARWLNGETPAQPRSSSFARL